MTREHMSGLNPQVTTHLALHGALEVMESFERHDFAKHLARIDRDVSAALMLYATSAIRLLADQNHATPAEVREMLHAQLTTALTGAFDSKGSKNG